MTLYDKDEALQAGTKKKKARKHTSEGELEARAGSRGPGGFGGYSNEEEG